MPPRRGRPKAVPIIDPEDEVVEEPAVQHPVFKLTDKNLEHLLTMNIQDLLVPDDNITRYDPETKERLTIDKIVVENFKSYAGRQVIGPFHPHFSAIIGANGSGKSNIIDALMFVFGFRAKKIRSDRIQALIHKSSFANSFKSARVKVCFVVVRGDGGQSVRVPGTEFVIERTVRASGQSKFYYNNESVSKEVLVKKLMEHGIDMDHNRFLILQGEIEQISLMKPKAPNDNEDGLLEYLDDIIGTSKLKRIVLDLEAKVTAAHEAKQEHLYKIRQVEKKKNELVGPVREMVMILKLENQIAMHKHSIYCLQIYEGQRSLNSYTKKEAEIVKILENKSNRLTEIIESVKEAKKAIASQETELHSVRKELKKHSETLKTEELSVANEQKQLETKENKLKTSETNIKKASKKIKELENKPEEYETKQKELEEELVEAKEKREEIRPEYEEKSKEARQKNTALTEQLNKIGGELASARDELNQIEGELSVAQDQKENLSKRLEDSRKRYEETNVAFGKADEDQQRIDTDLKKVKQELPDIQATHSSIYTRIAKLKTEEIAAVQKYETLKSRFNSADMDRSSYQHRSAVLKIMMEEKRSGRIPGILGRLGDLGCIDPKYDVAISAYNSFDQIICDSGETVKKCLQVIQERRLTRTNFISLSNVPSYSREMQPMDTPCGLPRFFDLVKPDKEEYRKAFYHILHSTLVTDKDINFAHQAAKPFGPNRTRFTVFTTGGDSVSSSGHLTGGGSARDLRRGAMRLTTAAPRHAEVDIAALKREVEEARDQLNVIRQELVSLEGKAIGVEKEKKHKEDMCRRLEKGLTEVKFKYDNLKKNIEIFKAKFDEEEANFEGKTSELERKITDLTKRQKQLKLKKDEVQSRYDECNEKIDCVYVEVCGESKEIFEKWGSKIKEIEAEQKKVKNALNKAVADMNRLKRNLVSDEELVESLKTGIEESKKKIEEATSRIQELQVVVEEKQKTVDELTEAIKKESLTVNETDAEEVRLNKEIGEMAKEKSNLKEKINQQTTKITELTAKKDHLKLYDLQEFLADNELADMDLQSLRTELNNVEEIRRSKKTPVNMDILNTYRERMKECNAHYIHLKKLSDAIDRVQSIYDNFVSRRMTEFMKGLNEINDYLKEQYYHLSLGGEAQISPISPVDAYTDGVIFRVRPPSKGWREIALTSGGEKTLSSLSLVFALHQYQPTPFYVMDEIDAALDFKNVKMIARFVKQKTTNSQFIIISLRDNMYQAANRLIGVSKINEMASCVVINRMDRSDKENRRKETHMVIMPA